jgi:hypothetical protein
MGLPWVRLDTQFASNPKFLYLVEDKRYRAILVWMAGLAYCGGHGTDGFIPRGALPLLHGNSTDAAALVEVALWEESLGGWQIHDWSEFQLSTEEMDVRRKRAQLAAEKRWRKNEGRADGC